MTNIIEQELAKAKEKMFATDDENDELVKLTSDNVAIVEAMIRNDSAYIKSSDKKAFPKYNTKNELTYNGSTAYWISMLREHMISNIDDIGLDNEIIYQYFKKLNKDDEEYQKTIKEHPDIYKYIIQQAVIAVDNENSTHINSDGVGREQISERIREYGERELLNSLWSRDLDLFQKIEKETDVAIAKVIKDNIKIEYRSRTNTSFASKFCHYACFYLFEGAEQQDNYSIHDSVLNKVLPNYFLHYNVVINAKFDEKVNILDFLSKSTIDYMNISEVNVKQLFKNSGEFQFEDIIRVNKKVSTILNKNYKKFFGRNKNIVDICDKTEINNYLYPKITIDKGEWNKNKTSDYIKKYNILTYYSVYRDAVDAIREKAKKQNTNEIISRNGFDHLLWYYHKGRLE